MRYADVKPNDIANGPRVRVTFWVQGCPHRCQGCHNPETWDFNKGEEYTDSVKDEIIDFISKDGTIRDFSVLGGEPLCAKNVDMVLDVIQSVRQKYPDINIWLWTGYVLEDLIYNEKTVKVLNLIDVLVDGLFIEEQKDLKLKFKGSKNQRVIDIKKSLLERKIIIKEGC